MFTIHIAISLISDKKCHKNKCKVEPMAKLTSMVMQEICDLLDTYKGRDKVLRTLCYTTKLVAGLSNNDVTAKKFNIFSSQMSKTRAVLRLFDDLPMLKYTLEYGLGKDEPDKFMASLGVITNMIDQVYYPIEKMSWLAEHRLINAEGDKWDTASSIFWIASLYLTLMRSLRYFNILQQSKMKLMDNECKETFRKVIGKQKIEALSCLRLSLDLVHAVNTLPPGFLWSSKLKTWHVGLIGTFSSVLGLYQIYARRYYLK